MLNFFYFLSPSLVVYYYNFEKDIMNVTIEMIFVILSISTILFLILYFLTIYIYADIQWNEELNRYTLVPNHRYKEMKDLGEKGFVHVKYTLRLMSCLAVLLILPNVVCLLDIINITAHFMYQNILVICFFIYLLFKTLVFMYLKHTNKYGRK